MNVLVVTHRLPFPPRDGARVRAFHIIKHLSARHDVTVASPARSAGEMEAAHALAGHCRRVIVERLSNLVAGGRMIAYLPTSTPSSMAYFYAPALARRIRRVLAEERFDLVVVHSSSVAQYVEDVATVPKLMDFVDMDSQKWLAYARHRRFPLSLGYALEGRKLSAAEAAIAGRFDVCTCISPSEQATLDEFGVACTTGWFPNGVDTDYFSFDADTVDAERICFVGRMDYYPNQQAMIDFCTEILPRILARRPRVKLTIVGANPSAAVRRLTSQPGVTVTGTVDDVRPWVRGAALTVAPIKIARGTQNKILESWAMGVPVVASSHAARGIDAEPGVHLLVADEPQDFAEAVIRLLDHAEERRRLAETARSLIEGTYTWAAAMRRLDKYVAVAVERHRKGLGDGTKAPPQASTPLLDGGARKVSRYTR